MLLQGGPVNELDAGTPREGLVRTFPYDYEHMTRELEEIDFETLSHDCLIEHSDPSGYCTTHNCVAYPYHGNCIPGSEFG